MKGAVQKTILLVEDEAIISMAEKMTLEKFGYQVLTAFNGEEAVALVKKTPAIDLILMDIDLGKGMDGTEAAEIILQDREIPVVFLSSHTEAEIVARTERITCYGFIVKNSNDTIFQALIKMVFKLFESKKNECKKESRQEPALTALRESEERAQALLKAIPDMLFRVNRQGVYLDYRADARDLYDQSGSSLIGKNCRDILPADFADLLEAKVGAAMASGTLQTFEYQLPVPGRGVRDYEARMAASGSDEVTVIVRDITESKRAEATLQKSEMQLKAMLDNSPVVILLIQEGKLIYINPAAEKMIGWPEEEFIGKSFTIFVHKDDQEIAVNKNRERMAGNNFLPPYVLRITKKTGGFIYAEINGTVIDLDGKPTMLGFLTDITERKRAEQELRESKALIEAVVENVPLMVFLKEATDLRFVIFNRAGEELLGYDRQSLLGKSDLDFFPAQQAAFFIAKDREVLDGEAGMLDIPEESIQTAEKGPRLLHTRKVSVRGADGTTKYLLGISEDITERKRTESQREAALEALRESEERFHSLFDNMGEGVALHELVFAGGKPVNYRIIDTNNRFTKIIGVPREQVIGKLATEAYGTSKPPYFEKYAGVGIDKKSIIFETYFASLNKHFAISVAPWGENGFATIFSDISDRKRAEAEIAQQLAEKEILLKEVHHRIKNNIAAIGGLLSMRLQSITNPEAAAVLQDAIGRVNSMRILYDKLLHSTEYKDIPVKNYIESLVDAIVALFPDSARIKVEKRIADFQLDAKRLFPLGLIINELLTNKMKYAFIGRDSGQIRIFLTQSANRVRLIFQDDGVGLPPGFDIDRSKGFGLTLVKMLSQQLGGNFSIESHVGTRSTLEFDI